MADYILRHKDRDVAKISIDKDGDFEDFSILDRRELPILGGQERKNLPQWITDRAIPEGRPDLEKILKEAGCSTPEEYLIQNLALSLTDSYWLCPEEERELKWKGVNLYSNPTEVLTFRAGIYASTRPIRANSSLGGSLEKRNEYQKDGWHMIKGGDKDVPFGLQSINEAFAAAVHQAQGFREYTRYTLNFNEYGECESCDCKYFTDAKHELISAYNVTGGTPTSREQKDIKDTYKEFVDTCVQNGLGRQYVENFMDYMLLSDFLLSNTDRHWENFGILRDPDSLRFLSMAPLFDTGTSMMCRDSYIHTRAGLIRMETDGPMRSQEENLSIIKNRRLLDIEKLPSETWAKDFYVRRGVPEEKAEQIAGCYSLKKDMLTEFQRGYPISVNQEYIYGTEPPVKNGKPNPLCSGRRKTPHLVVLCGIPDSGKEKAAEKYLKKYPEAVYIRTNNIREEIGLERGEDEQRVFDSAYRRVRKALESGKDVVYIATNLDKRTRKEVLALAGGTNAVKTLDVVYRDPADIVSKEPEEKLERMAEILRENKPDQSEGWDEVQFENPEPQRARRERAEQAESKEIEREIE